MLNLKGVTVFISGRKDGQMIASRGGKKNRDVFFKKHGIEDVVSAGLVHGSQICVAHEGDTRFEEADGLVTEERDLFLSVTGSDCFPVFASDGERVGIAHAGWRGVIKNIAGKLIGKLKELGSDPKDIVVGVGPGIDVCHFEVSKRVRDIFEEWGDYIHEKVHIDLKGIIEEQVRVEGVNEVVFDGRCTCCSDELFSYRRDRPEKPVSVVALIGLRSL